MKITSKRKGKRRLRDYRIRFDGEIRSNTGVWTQEQCRAVLEKFWLFLKEEDASHWNFIVVATPGKDKEEPIE